MIIPITIEATVIFIKDDNIFLIPNDPTFFLKLIINKNDVIIAEILVAKARPLIPKYFDNKTFKTIFIIIPSDEFITGVLVSCIE